MLLVLEPLSFVSFSICKLIGTVSLSFAFHVFSFVCVSVGIFACSLAMCFS